ncbi:MAG: hypothetical protein NTW13_01925 [Candidatus Omnitrophica bacterium]|nr:hypothetical protein [Candidatus Omnitrophota bacterium]
MKTPEKYPSIMNNFLFESELALKALSSGVELFEERYAEGFSVHTKGDRRDIVTELDLLIEKRIRDILKPSGYRIIGEEGTKNDSIAVPSNKLVWFVDPIDGTVNLAHTVPFYSISIGLVKNSSFVSGAVALPALKEIFFTMGNLGAYRNGSILSVARAELKESLVAVSFSSDSGNMRKRETEYKVFGIINDTSRGCLRLGSASVNICYAAAGRLQSVYGVANKIWDVAGSIAVALCAGCRVYIEWEKCSTRINFVVGAPGVADTIAEIVNKNKLAHLRLVTKG